MNKPQNIIVHHTLVLHSPGKKQLNGVNNYHQNEGYPISSLGLYVGYQYFIEEDGTVIQCRKDKEIGAHTSQDSMNTKSLGICLAGNFDVQDPTPAQYKALYELLTKKQKEHKISDAKVFAHRNYATYKSCWGSRLPNDIVRHVREKITKPPVVSDWAKESVAKAKIKGITDWKNPQEEVGTMTDAWMWHKLGLLENVWDGKAYIPITESVGVVTKEQRAVLFDRLGKL